MYGDDVLVKFYFIICSIQACYEVMECVIGLAKKYGVCLYIFYLIIEAEIYLFCNDILLEEKKIIIEVFVYYFWFFDEDYECFGVFIKWNLAIKIKKDKEGLLQVLFDDCIDFIIIDYVFYILEEKQKFYFQFMLGVFMVQYIFNCMLEFYYQGKILLEKIVEKMCYSLACFY